jgi:hypothetical protein
MTQEGSFNLTALCSRVLGDDQEPDARFGGELASAPESAGGKFSLIVGSFVKADFRG